MAGEVIVDALPYIDQGYDEPGVREAAFALVEEECRRYRPTKNYLELLPPLNVTAFETPMMHTEFERLQNRLPMDTMSMKRYELPPPPSGKLNEITAWNECVENSQAQLEHQSVRILNLQLMLEYCCPAWQRYLETLQDCERIASKKLAELKQALQEVNWQRKSLQTKGGEQLRNLEAKWVALVSHNYEIEQACCLAEEYVQQLRSFDQEQGNNLQQEALQLQLGQIGSNWREVHNNRDEVLSINGQNQIRRQDFVNDDDDDVNGEMSDGNAVIVQTISAGQGEEGDDDEQDHEENEQDQGQDQEENEEDEGEQDGDEDTSSD